VQLCLKYAQVIFSSSRLLLDIHWGSFLTTFMLARTRQSAATSVHRKGIEFLSTDADMPGKLHRCQTCSICVRNHKTKNLPFGATSRKVGSGCVGRTARGLAQRHVLAQRWGYRSLYSYSGLK
jgi:hypothetical protein